MAAQSEVSILVRLRDEASAAVDQINNKLKGIQSSMEPAANASKVFGAALLGAGVAAAGFGYAAVKAASDAQAEDAKMDATLKASKGNFEANRAAVLKAAEAAIKLGFDDEDAANSVAKLYQRTGDMTEALKLNQIAMDLARAKNMDLAQASQMVGMVLSGNGRILKEFDVEVDETKTPMQQLAELQQKVAGQSAAYASTFQGQMAALKVGWGNFMETVGDQPLPILTKLLTVVNEFVTNQLPQWIEKTKEIIQWMREHKEIMLIIAGAILGALIPAFISMAVTLFTTVIPAFVAGAVALAPWMLAGALIVGIVEGVLWIIRHWDLVKQKAAEVWDWIKNHLATIALALGPIGPLVVAIVKAVDLIIDNWDRIKETTEKVWNAIRDFFKGVWEQITQIFQAAANQIMSIIQPVLDAANKVGSTVSGGMNWLNAKTKSVLGLATGGIVTQPTLSWVGEAGPEAVIPLDRLNQLGAGQGGGLTVVVTGNTFMSDQEAAVEIGNQIAARLKLVTRLGL